MGEIYRDQIKKNLESNNVDGEEELVGADLEQKNHERIVGIQRRMMEGNEGLGQDEDAAYHLNVELHNQ